MCVRARCVCVYVCVCVWGGVCANVYNVCGQRQTFLSRVICIRTRSGVIWHAFEVPHPVKVVAAALLKPAQMWSFEVTLHVCEA